VRGFVTLLRKEWCDLRAATWVFAAVVLAGCLAVRWTLSAFSVKSADPNWQRWLDAFVPACVLLYAAMAAADTVGGETASGRIDQSVLLPVRPLTVWTAKAAMLFAAVTVFFAWTLLVQIGVLWTIDGRPHVERFFEFAERGRPVPVLVAMFAALTLLVSTLRLRGLGAVIAAAGLAAVLAAGGAKYAALVGLDVAEFAGRSFVQRLGGDLSVLAIGLTVALLVASALAYSRGRVHLSIVRPAALAAAVLVALVAAPAGVYAAVKLRVDPASPYTTVQWVAPSPDGRHVAVWMGRSVGSGHRWRGFVVDVATGSLRDLPREQIRISPFGTDATWDADGSLVVQDFTSSGVLRDWLDPDTLAVRRSRTMTFRELADEDRGASEEWRRTHAWMLIGTSTRPETAPETDPPLVGRIQKSADARVAVLVPTWIPPVMTYGTDRVVFAPEPAALAVKTVPDGAPHVFLRSTKPFVREDRGPVSADGTMVLVRVDGVWRAVSVESGEAVDVPGATSSDRPTWWTVQGDAARKLVAIVRRDGPVDVCDVRSGARAALDAYSGNLLAMPDGTLLRWRGKTFDLLDRDLRFVRRVWSVESEGGAK
jgi:hypothetical protein